MKYLLLKTVLFLITTSACVLHGSAQVTLVSNGSTWKYLDNNTRPASWETSVFNDASWVSGPGELGYGDGDEATVVSYGGNATNKYITTYFRKTINIPNPSAYSNFTLNVERDDGVVVYINGTEAGRSNMPAGPVAHGTLATAAVEDGIAPFTIATSAFVAGDNVIAVEIHQAAANSSDISFNLELIGNDAFSSTVTRGPYLQMGGQTSIKIRWRTAAAQNSRVEIGTVFGTYPTFFTDATSITEHEITVTGLSPDTKYWYRIGNSTNMSAPDADKFFRTVPTATPNRKLRFAAFGDCGRNDLSFRTLSISQYQNYLSTNGIDAADAWILLGDNAYTNGTDAEYTSGFFTPFQSNLLKNHKLYPAPGNHDYYGATQTSRTHAYYQNFTIPTAAELGGVASGTEAFYSFDIGNVHFLSLDSYGIETIDNSRLYDTLGPQVTWVKNDLAANTKKWVIAYFHHPPYTMGSHNSDTEGELINIRTNFIRILERMGVDLVLCGHSHDYERSYLLKGHYGNEASFNAGTHAVSNSSAKYDGSANSAPYTTVYNASNHGTVYTVAGSAGADGGVQVGYPHNAFPFSIDDGGMLYFEVDDNRLDAKFLRRDGTIGDRFTIMQDVNKTNNYTIALGQSQLLTASWPGVYNWSTTETTRSITVTPPAVGAYNYSVTDQYGNITDQFTVNVTGTLPVLLKDYTANLRNKKVYVNWITATETNSNYFTIERSSNTRSFDIAGMINAAGNSNTERPYEFIDPAPLTGTSFYRLSQTDNDGHIKYFDIKRVTYNPAKNFFADIYQSAAGKVTVQLYNGTPDNVNIRVLDMSGRMLLSEDWKVSEGSNSKMLLLKKGFYIIELKKKNGESFTGKIIVQ